MEDTISRRVSFGLAARRNSLDAISKQIRKTSSICVDFQDLKGRLFDRDTEEQALASAYSRMLAEACGEPEFVLISGPSGRGKTALARSLQTSVFASGGFFIQGKFDQLQKPEPYSAIVAACAEYVDSVIKVGGETLSSVRESITSRVSLHQKFLVDMFPSLERILGEQIDDSSFYVADTHRQVKSIFRQFMRGISSRERPLVILLDDLQWADKNSLQLLEALATDGESSGLMIIGTFRNNEHALTSMMREIDFKSSNLIELSNLSENAVNEMVSHMLAMSAQQTIALSNVVYQQTMGNAFFVLQFMSSLRDEDLLYIDEDDLNWQWDEQAIQQYVDDVDVYDLVPDKIRKLPEDVLSLLQIAACIGIGFNEECVSATLGIPTTELLSEAVKQGLIEHDTHEGDYRFVHDRIQHAAYNLIPKEERSMFHLNVGRRLRESSLMENEQEHIFVVVNQLNKGSRLMSDEEERIDASALNLRAGQKAMLSSAFAAAGIYLNTGIKLLGHNPWAVHYELSLALFNTAAEVDYCNARFTSTERRVQAIQANAISFRDKLRALSTLIYCLGAQNRKDEAITAGVKVLKQLGERFPKKAGKAMTAKELIKTMWMLRGLSDEKILRLPSMRNKDKLAAMQLLNLVFSYTYLARSDITPLLVFRMVQLTLKYGLCTISSCAFSRYGLVLCAMNDLNAGYRYGQLALSLLEKFNAKAWVARVYVTTYGAINHWVEPTRLSLEPLMHAHRLALETGDIEQAMMASLLYLLNSIDSGCSLNEQEAEGRIFYEEMVQYKQEIAQVMICPRLQMILNLRGQSKDPLKLTGEFMNQEATLERAAANGDEHVVCFVHELLAYLAFLFGAHERAASMGAKCQNIEKYAAGTVSIKQHCYIEALNEAALAHKHKSDRNKHMARATKNLRRMQKWAKQSDANNCPRILLVQAQIEELKGNVDETLDLYGALIKGAWKEGWTQDEALANELAGRFADRWYLQRHANDFFKRAYVLYVKWGAQAKADHLKATVSYLKQ